MVLTMIIRILVLAAACYAFISTTSLLPSSSQADLLPVDLFDFMGVGASIKNGVVPNNTSVRLARRKSWRTSNDELQERNAWAKIKLFNGTRGCLLEPSLQYLGCGHDGHVYLGNISCPWGSSRPIAVKFPTRIVGTEVEHGTNRTRKILEYGTDIDAASEEERWKAVHDIVLGNTSSVEREEALTMFSLFYGTANITQPMLIDYANKAARCHLGTISASDPTTSVMGKIMSYAPGESIGGYLGRNRLSTTQKQIIVSQLVRMYSHLFDRNFMHCDMENLAHILFNLEGSQTTLVDFDRSRLIETLDPNRADMQLWQQIQLLSIIGNVCNDIKKSSIPIINACSGTKRSETTWEEGNNGLRQMVVSALKKCQFSGDPPNFSAEKKWTVREIQRNYEALKGWATVQI